MRKISIGDVTQLSIIILILGLIKSLVFYSAFNVPIKYFTSFSEVSIFISDNLLILAGNLLLLYYSIFRFSPIFGTAKKNVGLAKKLLNRLSDESFTSIIFSLIVIGVNIWYFFISKKTHPNNLLYWSILIFSLFNLIIPEIRKEVSKETLSKAHFLLIYYFVFTLSVLLVTAGREVSAIQKGKFNGSSIVAENHTYIINDSLLFVGKSDKYVFLYRPKDSTSLILSSEKVETFNIKTNW